jgi:DNA invertase Pin-like site-specific DNA recombinase
MKRFLTFGSLMAAVMLSGSALAAELETDAQKLGYIIGMDIGSSLQKQGTELDLDALFEAIKNTYNGEELAMTPEEAATIRESFIAKRRAETESEREGLERVLELARSKKVNKVLVHEVSRIARRNSTVHRFVEELCDLGVSVYWHAQGIETLMRSGKRNPSASVMLALLAEMARAERETLVERIQSGLVEARRKGRRLGRPPGSAITPAALLRKHRDIVRMLRHGQSVRNTAKITGKGMSTVQRVKRAMDGQSSLT